MKPFKTNSDESNVFKLRLFIKESTLESFCSGKPINALQTYYTSISVKRGRSHWGMLAEGFREYGVEDIGPKTDEVTGEWRRLHKAELNDRYSSPNIIRVIKSRTMRHTGHVARMGNRRSWYRVLMGKRPLLDPCIHGRIILKWIFKKWDREHGLGVSV